jgi:uncharacterized protein
MKKFFLTFTVILGSISACSTIEIKESDVFDAHRTVTPQNFSLPNHTLIEQSLTTDDGETLDSWVLLHDEAEATVLYLGGNGFLMIKSKPLIEAYSEIPVNLVLFDYRGYGLSSGEPTVRGIQTDAETAYRYSKELMDGDSGSIIVHGHSMGSFLASYLAEKEDVSGYILESPVTEVSEWTRSLIPWVLRPFIRFEIDEIVKAQSNSEKVKLIKAPLLIIGGNSDEITPFKMAEELRGISESGRVTLVEINGGGHNDLPLYQQYRDAISNFIIDFREE